VRDLVADGYVGRLLSCTVYCPTMSGGPVRSIASRHTIDAADATSTLTITTGHVIDTIGYALGELQSVSAIVETLQTRARIAETGEELEVTAPDQVVLAGRLASGAVVSVHCHNASRPHGLGFHASLFGTEGDLQIVSDGATGIQIGELTVHGRRGDDALQPVEIPERYYDVAPELRPQPLGNVAQALRRFARSIRDSTPYSPDFTTAVQRHETLDAIHRSAFERRRVDVT
jgi:predicted dehydrogenase